MGFWIVLGVLALIFIGGTIITEMVQTNNYSQNKINHLQSQNLNKTINQTYLNLRRYYYHQYYQSHDNLHVLNLSVHLFRFSSLIIENNPYIMNILSKNKQIPTQFIIRNYKKIGQGYDSQVYADSKRTQAIKMMKGFPNQHKIIKEVIVLERVYKNMFNYLIFDQMEHIVGFSMEYFHGKRLWESYTDEKNILYYDKAARVRLIQRLRKQVKRIQQLGFGHGDFHLNNILIKQPDKRRQNYQLLIVDYGLAFMTSSDSISRFELTGWQFMLPPQCRSFIWSCSTSRINSYMFGRIALQILHGQTYNDNFNITTDYPFRQIQELTVLGYKQNLKEHIQRYLNEGRKAIGIKFQ